MCDFIEYSVGVHVVLSAVGIYFTMQRVHHILLGYYAVLSGCRNAGELPIHNITTQCCFAGLSAGRYIHVELHVIFICGACRIVGCRYLFYLVA